VLTTDNMRQFSFACLRWAPESCNPSDRQVIISTAREWLTLAGQIDPYVEIGRAELRPDLKRKLN
jgi:hypothetical protein